MLNKLVLFCCIFFLSVKSIAQENSFGVYLDPFEFKGLPGLQSYTIGTFKDKWLIIGGRLDGLHRRQPFASFDEEGFSKNLVVVDLQKKAIKTYPLKSLPVPVAEQFSATNMQFFQEGGKLYITGGYGYSATKEDHTTYPYLTVVDVAKVIEAIENNISPAGFIKQVKDEKFAVTGGKMHKIYTTFYLVGGQKFEGRYNPHGPDHGPGFVQEYTNAIRRFNIEEKGESFVVRHLKESVDSFYLHKRDNNMLAQILPNGQEGLTTFSGVFNPKIDFPYLHAVNIDSVGFTPAKQFSQYYSHYHCATLPLFDAEKKEMHNIFFGGIAQFYDDKGMLVSDADVPFVNTISNVKRSANGDMSEYLFPLKMPGLLGASAEFIMNDELPLYDNGVVKLNELSSDTTFAGYIYGGISSKMPNVFWETEGEGSSAASNIYKVYILKKNIVPQVLNVQSRSSLHLQVYPEGSSAILYALMDIDTPKKVAITVTSASGKMLINKTVDIKKAGPFVFKEKITGLKSHKYFLVEVETSEGKLKQKVLVK